MMYQSTNAKICYLYIIDKQAEKTCMNMKEVV